MDTDRHDADHSERYRAYFKLLHTRMTESDVLPENTYNMDEKGFMIGVIDKSKRVFDKVLYKERRFKQASHDGNRDWVTVIGAMCADGTTLPPAVIFPATGNKIQANWVRDIDPKKHSLYVGVSPTGWTNDDLGVEWLKKVFDPPTKRKARRKYRALVLDGHGSHVTRRFIDYCDKHRILLLIFPPHATHTLQPLDVACFKSLSQNYSKELVEHNHFTAGWIPLNKADFISLFWPAWVDTFTEKLVLSAFESTGINPPDADVILDRFKRPPPLPTPSPPATPPAQTEPQPALSEPNWLRCKSDLNRAVKYGDVEAANSVIQQVHQYHVLNELKDHQIQGFKDAAEAKKRRNKKKKVLPLSPRDPNVQGGATFFDSGAIARANHRMRVKEKEDLEAEAAKKTKKRIELNNKLLKAKQQADTRKKRLEDAEKRAQIKAQEQAEKDARRAEKEAARAFKEASKVPKKARKKASAKPQSKVTKRGGGAGRRRVPVVHERSPTPPLRQASSGRVIRPTERLR
jgi:hypothetical protein